MPDNPARKRGGLTMPKTITINGHAFRRARAVFRSRAEARATLGALFQAGALGLWGMRRTHRGVRIYMREGI